MDKLSCQATVETRDPRYGAKQYSMQRVTVMGSKPCSHKATVKVGSLCLCAVHARMTLEGLVAENGTVAPKADIVNSRLYPDRFPYGLYSWAAGLKAELI